VHVPGPDEHRDRAYSQSAMLGGMTGGELVRSVRERRGLSQATLAARAGTTQTSVSRLENGGRSPSVETVRRLLRCMGEDLVLDSRPLRGRFEPAHLAALRAVPMAERVERAFGWMRLRAALRDGARTAGRR